MTHEYQKAKILIWGKTYPELSASHTETVCTGGVRENGFPVRLYPIPLRYLDGSQQFSLYQWIEAEIAKDYRDPRPESYRVKEGSIILGEPVPSTSDEWGKRAEYVLKSSSWQFSSVEELWERRKVDNTSLGVVIPREIKSITELKRSAEERDEFERKFEDLRVRHEAKQAQIPLFETGDPLPELKKLAFPEFRFQVEWLCHGAECNGHTMKILDWGLGELARKVGVDDTLKKLNSICDIETNALKFFLGNIKAHPDAFTIVGLWYPRKDQTPRLF